MINRQTRQDARGTPLRTKRGQDTSLVADTPPASNLVPPESARKGTGWRPPRQKELQAALEHLIGKGPQDLRVALKAADKRGWETSVSLSSEDWRIIAWAVNAWAIQLNIVERDMTTAETSNAIDPLIRKASVRAASIWRD